MPLSSRRPRRSSIDIWPGFVDALTQLVMVIVFVLLIFTAGQFFLTDALSGRDAALQQLTRQVNELADMLAMERKTNTDLRGDVSQLSLQLQASNEQRDALTTRVAELAARADEATAKLDRQSADLAEAQRSVSVDKDKIDLETSEIASLQHDIEALKAVRADLESKVTNLAAALDKNNQDLTAARDRSKELEAQLSTEQERTALAQKEIDKRDIRVRDAGTTITGLSQQVAALQQELQRLSAALDLANTKTQTQAAQLADLGQKLNLALLNKVEELATYRSEFFGELRKILGDRPDIHVVGDRFVFQSEVLFEQGSADISDSAKQQLTVVANALKEIATKIPKNIPWVLRVDGHTDKRPINTPQFKSNWELSTARAVSVVKFLIDQGVPPDRLAAAGFGEFQPIAPGDTEDAFKRDRRIELKLTER